MRKTPAWLIRDKMGKMKRAIFFYRPHAQMYIQGILGWDSMCEIVKIRIDIDLPKQTKEEK